MSSPLLCRLLGHRWRHPATNDLPTPVWLIGGAHLDLTCVRCGAAASGGSPMPAEQAQTQPSEEGSA